MSTATPAAPDLTQAVTPQLQWEVEQFLYAEARLLDERRFTEWYTLVADDIHYFMPTRVNRLPNEQHLEVRAANQGAHFDDDKQRLGLRVKKLGIDRNWSEYPASRTRHLITNVWIAPGEREGEYRVQSYFHFYRSRMDRQVENLVGVRDDILRRATNPYGFELAQRTISLDQTVLLSGSITTFL